MSPFDFAFTLFGLLLGLSLAEIFGGFARALRGRRKTRIGWLSPMLALVMVVDLASHWLAAWNDRASIAITFPTLLFGTAIAGLYYMAAALVFPDDVGEWRDLDENYFNEKLWIVLAIQLSNTLFVIAEHILHGHALPGVRFAAILALWLGSALALILARRRWLNAVLLLWYLQLYWLIHVI